MTRPSLNRSRPAPLAMAALMLAAGCVTIPGLTTDAPHGWPELTVELRVVTPERVTHDCRGGPGNRVHYLACAIPDFMRNICYVYVPHGYSAELLAHELGHCKGLSHKDDPGWARTVMDVYRLSGVIAAVPFRVPVSPTAAGR